MRVIYLLLSFMLCFYPVTQAQNTTNQFMTQAQSSLEKKDYTKARYLFLQAYKSLSQKGDYKQAIDAGTQAAYLYYRENYYQEAFDLCRQMNQFILTEEQKLQKSLYEQRFQVTKERLEMYIKLKNAAQAQVQLNTLDNLASQAGDEKLSNNLLYTQAGYYYTFGQNEQGDAAFQKLINQGMILGTSYKDKRGALVPTDQVELTPAGPVRKSDGEPLTELPAKMSKSLRNVVNPDDVIRDYGEEHMKTGALIVYTSADSVFQIAANEAIVPVEKLYEICAQARELLTGKYGVGRVIARPFVGDCAANFTRTPRRHDYSLVPPHDTMLDAILAAGKQTIGVGKIHDIFAGKGIGETIRTSGNTEGLQVTLELADRDFEGLAFVNLVDFDMLYGHRRNIAGYAAAAAEFNDWLPGFMAKMRPGDILMVTADHGCDPSYTKTTDHTREHVPFLIYGDEVKPGVNLHTRYSFATIADTVCKALGVDYCPAGCGVYDEIAR